MRNHKPPADKRHHGDAPTGILRTDLLTSRFSETEIQRLSRLQLRYRERPDARDMPIEECRLQFAHWLVEQGRLSEDDGSGLWKRLPESPEDRPDGCVDGEMASARTQQREVGRRPLFGALSWVRRGLAGRARRGHPVGNIRSVSVHRSVVGPVRSLAADAPPKGKRHALPRYPSGLP